MAIPEYIRKVPRPVNTVVVDNGKDGPNRYAVRERTGIKYIRDGTEINFAKRNITVQKMK